jgi:hypothetical protein
MSGEAPSTPPQNQGPPVCPGAPGRPPRGQGQEQGPGQGQGQGPGQGNLARCLFGNNKNGNKENK